MMLRRLVMVVGKEQLGPTRLVKSLIFLRLDARSLAPSSSVRRRLAASFSSAARSGRSNDGNEDIDQSSSRANGYSNV